MNNVAAGNFVDDETGEALNDVETVLNKLGIALRNSNDEFRDTSDVLDEVASRWNEFSDVQRNAISTAMAGSRNFEKFSVLMENYGSAVEYAEVATSSAGTAMEKYSAYTDGISGKMNSLTATFEEFSMTLLDSDLIANGVDVLRLVVGFLTTIASFADGFLVIVPAITAALIALHAVLVKIQASATFATMLSTAKGVLAVLPAMVAQLKMVVTTIWAKVAAHTAETTALSAQTAATNAATAAQKAMNATNPIGWIMLAVTALTGLVKLIDHFASAEAKASESAKELAVAKQEKAQKTSEELETLDSLIARYQELRSQETVSADSREELRDIQKEINLLVGDEAQQWDAVNGSIEDNIKALQEMRAQKARDALQDSKEAYVAAQTSANIAYEVDTDEAGLLQFASDFVHTDLVTKGWDKQGTDILSKVDGIEQAGWGGTNLFNGITSVIFDDEIKGAEEHLALINKAKKALEDDQSYDHWNSELYAGLDKLGQQYAEYVTTSNEARDAVVENAVEVAGYDLSLDGMVVDSIETYEKFKQTLIDAAAGGDALSDAIGAQQIAIEDVTEAAEAYMAKYYGELYDKFAANAKGLAVSAESAVDILEEVQNGYDGLAKALSGVTSEGYLTADALSTLYQLESDNALAGLKLEDILIRDAYGYRIAEDSLQQYLQALIAFYRTEWVPEGVYASEQAKQNAIKNWEQLRATIATVVQTQEESIDADQAHREELEKQQDVYNNRLDAYREIIDLRKDLLETYEEELSYQKELAERQRNVTSLQAKLAVARLDQSAAGQARVRELEAELKEAQDDLEDFTLEHAIDVLTNQLESQYTEYESFIQSKLSEIQDALDNISASDYVDVMKRALDIIDEYLQETQDKEVAEESNGGKTRWRSYQEAADSGYSNIKTEKEFARGGNDKITYGNYQAYLDAMYQKYTGKEPVVSDESFLSSDNAVLPEPTDLSRNPLRVNSVPMDDNISQGLINTTPHFDEGKEDEEDEEDGGYRLKNKKKKRFSILHSGGLVGNVATLSSNEEFAKLLKGEFVSTPAQMERFMEETLPQIANYAASSSSNEFNAPLIEITCESVTSESLPDLQRVVNDAVKEIKKQLDSGMRRTGYKHQRTGD